jgi:hypothetical protein
VDILEHDGGGGFIGFKFGYFSVNAFYEAMNG